MVKYRIHKDADAPVPRRGRRLKWRIPLDEIEPGSVLALDMDPVEAREKINAVRSHVAREQKKMGQKFSVMLFESGIAIFHQEDEDTK